MPRRRASGGRPTGASRLQCVGRLAGATTGAGVATGVAATRACACLVGLGSGIRGQGAEFRSCFVLSQAFFCMQKLLSERNPDSGTSCGIPSPRTHARAPQSIRVPQPWWCNRQPHSTGKSLVLPQGSQGGTAAAPNSGSPRASPALPRVLVWPRRAHCVAAACPGRGHSRGRGRERPRPRLELAHIVARQKLGEVRVAHASCARGRARLLTFMCREGGHLSQQHAMTLRIK